MVLVRGLLCQFQPPQWPTVPKLKRSAESTYFKCGSLILAIWSLIIAVRIITMAAADKVPMRLMSNSLVLMQ